MKAWGTVGLMLAPMMIGAISGWYYSDLVVGHKPSAEGWFDLRPLDPVFSYLQNVISSVVFGGAGAIAFIIVRSLLAKQLTDNRLILTSSLVASLLVCGYTALNVIRVDRAREARQDEMIKQLSAGNARDRQLTQAVTTAFSKLGWVRYPNLRTDAPNPKGGFQINAYNASFAPSDDAETVANYYLSRCESWQENPQEFSAVVRNEGTDFLVRFSKQDGGIDSIETTDVKPLANRGTTHWSGKAQSDNPSSPQEVSPPPNPLIYAGATTTELSDSIRQFTADDIVKVLAFYRSVGAHQIDADNDDCGKHSLEVGDDPNKQIIDITSVHERDGTQGTLIVVHKGQ